MGRREEWEGHLKKNDVDRLLAYLKDTEIFLKENRYPPAESQEILEKMVRELVQCLKNLHIQNHLTFEEPATPLYHTSCQLILHAQELLDQWKSRCEDTQGNRVSSSIEAALQYMESHLNQPLTLSEVAEHVYMSTSYLSKLFKEQLHENFNDYVYRRKMEHAAKLLTETETSVEHIAENLGFSSANYFIRRFKKYYGTTPSVFQNNHRKS